MEDKMTLIHADEKTNKLLFYRKLTDSVFEYTIDSESWLYICPWEMWSGIAPKYGAKPRKKKIKDG